MSTPGTKSSTDRTRTPIGRRKFIATAGAVAAGAGIATWVDGDLADAAPSVLLEGYADRTSVKAGDHIGFCVNNGLGRAEWTNTTLTISRVGYPTDTVLHSSSAPVFGQTTPGDASLNGCRWNVARYFEIPSNWRSGFYNARFDDGTNHCTIPFVVRPRKPAAAMLLQVPFTTAQAYNDWGGKSLYGSTRPTGCAAPRCRSIGRTPTRVQRLLAWVHPFVRYAERTGIALDYASSVDMHTTPALLDPYQLFVTVGHDEYWSYADAADARPVRSRRRQRRDLQRQHLLLADPIRPEPCGRRPNRVIEVCTRTTTPTR